MKHSLTLIALLVFCGSFSGQEVSFSGACNDGKVDLFWETNPDINCDYFCVERSFNFINFETVGIVYSSGKSSQRYNFEADPSGSEAWYRLKQVDFDGAYKLFEPVFVICAGSSDLETANVFYNSSSHHFVFENLPVGVDIRVMIVNTEMLQPIEFVILKSLSRYEMYPGELFSGLYVIKLECGAGVRTFKLLLE